MLKEARGVCGKVSRGWIVPPLRLQANPPLFRAPRYWLAGTSPWTRAGPQNGLSLVYTFRVRFYRTNCGQCVMSLAEILQLFNSHLNKVADNCQKSNPASLQAGNLPILKCYSQKIVAISSLISQRYWRKQVAGRNKHRLCLQSLY